MRNRMDVAHCVFHILGSLLLIVAGTLLVPIPVAVVYWGVHGEGWRTIWAFASPALLCGGSGLLLRGIFRDGTPKMAAGMLICALGWLAASAFGALPFVLGIGSSYLDGYFEAMSGFTTTGITVFTGLDTMPRSIIFWRALTQWLGGTGILSFFLLITFGGAGTHHIFGAESHKISSARPVPGLFNTLRILWGIYAGITVLGTMALVLEGMSPFDAVCHTFTALSTGGFSPYDASIAEYGAAGYGNYRAMEYTLTLVMLLGGMNFLIHYRVLTGDFKALRDNIEVRTWWRLLAAFTALILVDHLLKASPATHAGSGPGVTRFGVLEEAFRVTVFQVVSILTTTGFGTRDIGSEFFPALSRQLFLVMMVIGGCVGSTGGGIKVLRVAILNRLLRRELLRLRVPSTASTPLVIDGKAVPEDEIHRVAALFFGWMGLLLAGGAITAAFTDQTAWASFSGMFSALGNIGPCFISVPDMVAIHPAVKVTYILGMLAGRLEILPVLLLFSRKAWV